jgi:PAS domain S-box-containing protein
MHSLIDKILGLTSTWPRQLVVAILYVLLGQLIHDYLLHQGTVSAFWPGSGLLLGAMLLGGRRYMWGALLGSLTLNIIANDSLLVIVGITVANIAELLLAYWLLRCKQMAQGCIDTLGNYLRFIALGGGLASLVGAFLGVSSLWSAGYIPPAEYLTNLLHWWMGDTLGVIIITPLMLAWQEAGVVKLSGQQRLEAALFSLVAMIIGQIVFVGWLSEYLSATPKGYWIFLCVTWAALRFGTRGITALVLMLAVQALWGSYREVGFFALDVEQAQLENYWAYMIVASVIGMTVSTYITALRHALEQNMLKDAALNAAAHGVVITDPNGTIEWANPAYQQNAGYALHEIIGRNPCELVKSGKQDESFYEKLWNTILDKRVWRGEMVNRRKDGSLFIEDMTITPITDEQGVIRHFVAVEQDITARKQADQALHRQNEKYLALLRNASDGIHILDREGNVIEASDSFCAMLGYRPDEVLKMNVAQWDDQFTAEEIKGVVAKQFDSHIRSQFETRHRRKDGTVIDVEVSGNCVEMEGRTLLFNSSRDISERKRISTALQQQLRFANGLNRISKTLVEQDDPELILQQTVQIVGEMLEADRTLIYDVSFDMKNVTGLSEWLNPSHPDTKHSKGTYPLEVFSSGAHHLQRSRTWFTSHSENINHYLQADGSGAFLHNTMNIRSLLWYPFAFTENGFYALVINQLYSHRDWSMPEIDFLDSVSHIVSLELEKLRLTKLSQEAEGRLRIAATAFESQEGMMITDANKRLLQVNRAFTAITGYTQEDVLGQTPRILSSGRHGADFYHQMWETIAQMGVWEGEIWNKRKNGEIYPEHLTITAVEDEQGCITNYVGALTDSTQRELALEQLRNSASELARANAQIEEERSQLAQRVEQRTAQLMYANKAKDSFLATMSHEIRTPLGGMLGMMELLGLSHLEAEQAEMLKVAHHSGKSLLRIVDDILDWSKIEAGKLELAPQVIPISEVLKAVTDTYAQLASAKDVLLEQHLDPVLGAVHLLDPLRVSQILNNFTSNAIKFTSHGRVSVSAAVVARSKDSETVRFSVKDSGIGISAAQQQRLFQNYAQGSAETARLYGGTGLGLAICRSLADLMGGNISVESELGQGSTFMLTLRLPLADAQAQTEWHAHAAPDAEQLLQHVEVDRLPGSERYAVLVIDDHPVNRIVLKQQLSQLGLAAETAEDGQAALALWRSKRFDLIITDCHMPVMDGYELTRKIRELEGVSAHTPILAWTANVMVEEAQHSRDAGMDDVLTKPTELRLLRTKLLQWLPQLQAAAPVVLDETVLAQLFPTLAAQAEMLREFVKQHLQDSAELQSHLAVGTSAAAQLADCAHRMKGACRMVGAQALAELCLRIEQAAKRNDLAAASALIEAELSHHNTQFATRVHLYGNAP